MKLLAAKVGSHMDAMALNLCFGEWKTYCLEENSRKHKMKKVSPTSFLLFSPPCLLFPLSSSPLSFPSPPSASTGILIVLVSLLPPLLLFAFLCSAKFI